MKNLKRYWLFAYTVCYPAGGMNDFVGSFDSVLECKNRFAGLIEDKYHIFDSIEQKVIEIQKEEFEFDFENTNLIEISTNEIKTPSKKENKS